LRAARKSTRDCNINALWRQRRVSCGAYGAKRHKGDLLYWATIHSRVALRREIQNDRPEQTRPMRSETRARLGAAIARGRVWLDELITDPTASAESIAKREQCSARKINMTPNARPSGGIIARSVDSGLRAKKRKFWHRGPETISLKFNWLFVETKCSYSGTVREIPQADPLLNAQS
jgi:hypothetical protein